MANANLILISCARACVCKRHIQKCEINRGLRLEIVCREQQRFVKNMKIFSQNDSQRGGENGSKRLRRRRSASSAPFTQSDLISRTNNERKSIDLDGSNNGNDYGDGDGAKRKKNK